MLTEAAVLGAALAADLVTLYLFYELTTLLSFPLVLHTQRPKALLGAVKYLYYSVCGGFIALFGVVLLAQQSSPDLHPGRLFPDALSYPAGCFVSDAAGLRGQGGSVPPCTTGCPRPILLPRPRPMPCSPASSPRWGPSLPSGSFTSP